MSALSILKQSAECLLHEKHDSDARNKSQIQLSPDPTIQGVHIAQLDGALDQRGDSIVAEATSVVACIVKGLLCLSPKLYGVLVE